MTEVDSIAAAFRGTALGGRPVEAGPGGTIVVTGIDPGLVLPAWRVARAALPETGRWPVLLDVDEFVEEPTPGELAALAEEAAHGDPWSYFTQAVDDGPAPDFQRELAASLTGAEPPAGIGSDELDEWLYEQVYDRPERTARVLDRLGDFAGAGQWFEPPAPVLLVLLPTPHQWMAPAWITYNGALDPAGRGALAGVLRQWEREHGAELVSCWFTMLQFTVSRPPRPGAQAWDLAARHLAVGGSLQMFRSSLALGLAHSDAWFLHDRP
jgi:hypothetical protein